jgi:hypothetical protein
MTATTRSIVRLQGGAIVSPEAPHRTAAPERQRPAAHLYHEHTCFAFTCAWQSHARSRADRHANTIPFPVPMLELALLYANQSGRCSAINASLDVVNFKRMQTASGQRLNSNKLHCDRENLTLICAAANEIDLAATSAIADADLWAMTAGASASSLSRHPLSEIQDDTVCAPYSQLGAVL